MDINATIDVGDNITGMLEKIAGQLGTTADKVFPWYVQQASIEGWTALAFLTIAILIFLPTFLVSIRMAKSPEREDGPNASFFVCIVAGCILFFTFLLGGMEGTEAVRKIMNPNYYAMKMMTRDIGNLVRK